MAVPTGIRLEGNRNGGAALRRPTHRSSTRILSIVSLTALSVGPSVALTPHAVSAAPLPTLEQAFDNIGITAASGATAGNFDGIGDSFPASGLSADALVPGGDLLHDGLRLTWPDVAAGSPDNVVADGQTVALKSQGSTLGIVGASAYGSATGTFAVNYTDGTSTTASATLSDWVDELPAAGTDLVATTGGWEPGGSIPVSLSYAAIAINPGEHVASVTLPTVSATVGQNVNSMHIFDLTVGTPGAQASGPRRSLLL